MIVLVDELEDMVGLFADNLKVLLPHAAVLVLAVPKIEGTGLLFVSIAAIC